MAKNPKPNPKDSTDTILPETAIPYCFGPDICTWEIKTGHYKHMAMARVSQSTPECLHP